MINDFELARQTAHDYYPDAVEVDEPTESMYRLDAIDSVDGQTSINIMYDEMSNVFVLVVEERQDSTMVEAAELETRRIMLIGAVELKAMMAFGMCKTVDDTAACWAALTSTISQSARLHIKELGGDVDEVTIKLDRFFLNHPEC